MGSRTPSSTFDTQSIRPLASRVFIAPILFLDPGPRLRGTVRKVAAPTDTGWDVKRLIRLPEVIATAGLGRTEIYRLMALGRFPKAVPLGARATAWDSDEVQSWVQGRIAAREDATADRAALGRRLVEARQAKASR
jgi:prophage regulatory protein